MKQKKLYVGSLPYKITEAELRTLFSSAGEVADLRIITDKINGQSKGFAFVEMATVEGAEKALEEINGKEVGGRKLIVSEARAPQQRTPGSGGGRGPSSFRGGNNAQQRPPRRDHNRSFHSHNEDFE